MSLPSIETPRRNISSKKVIISRTPSSSRNEVPSTPKNNRAKPPPIPADTPECFNKVVMETPKSCNNRRTSSQTGKDDEISNLTVAVRIRPMNARELACIGAADIVRVRNNELIIRSQPIGSASMSLDHIFQYDHVFWSVDENSKLYATQEDVFLTIGKPLLNSAFKGYNACLFAYGQTGSGKSFSMMGRNTTEIIDIDSDEHSGLIPRFCRDLFTRIGNLNDNSNTVEVSYFEIYNEKIHDLLSDGNYHNKDRIALKVREHPVWGPYVVDLSVHKVTSYKELRNWLVLGNKNRATASTAMNEKSSRSHSIFSIDLSLGNPNSDSDVNARRSRVSLVDLAGSERLGNSHNNDEKIRQGVCINKSLLTLGKVISALADPKNQFVPYRDSVLTWLLRESLGGNSLTSMLATITPSNTNIDETLATLRYACQARAIVNRARINESPNDKVIRQLRAEVERLRALRKDYERSSLSNSSVINISDSEEMNDLRLKLQETESRLLEAEKSWQKRFSETQQSQLRELAEAEKYKMELESKVRIFSEFNNADMNLSPYKSNFLQDLENVLFDSNADYNFELMEQIKDYCLKQGLACTFNSDSLTIIDSAAKKQTIVKLKDVNLNGHENIADYVESLTWREVKIAKNYTKSDIMTSMNQIYEALGNLQPPDNENQLNLLYAKVNKALLNFETALLNNASKNGQKTVTFNL